MNDDGRRDAELRLSESGENDERRRAPVDARTVALVLLAVGVIPFALYAGAAFFIPLLVSLFLSYALSPVVDRMERWRVPRAVGAAVTMLLVIALASAGVQGALSGATDMLEELPQAVQNLRVSVTSWVRDGRGPLKQVRKTADELQKLAGAAETKPASAAPPSTVAAPDSRTLIGAGTVGMAIFLGQLVSVLFLTYFFLAAGDLFRRRLLQALGPSLTRRKKALQILQQVHSVSQRYFALVLAMNITVGIFTALGLYLLGVRYPVFWGIAIAVLHTIPYVGAAVVTGAVGLSAFIQFENAGQALAAAAVPLAASALIGIWLQTTLMGRAARMNAVVVFIALLFWGMVWGGWGLLLAFPIMATVKIVFTEIERLKPIALLMGD
jgi:predicted PurR-regulated permease PerM